jgi:hypothetical protein
LRRKAPTTTTTPRKRRRRRNPPRLQHPHKSLILAHAVHLDAVVAGPDGRCVGDGGQDFALFSLDRQSPWRKTPPRRRKAPTTTTTPRKRRRRRNPPRLQHPHKSTRLVGFGVPTVSSWQRQTAVGTPKERQSVVRSRLEPRQLSVFANSKPSARQIRPVSFALPEENTTTSSQRRRGSRLFGLGLNGGGRGGRNQRSRRPRRRSRILDKPSARQIRPVSFALPEENTTTSSQSANDHNDPKEEEAAEEPTSDSTPRRGRRRTRWTLCRGWRARLCSFFAGQTESTAGLSGSYWSELCSMARERGRAETWSVWPSELASISARRQIDSRNI